MSRTYPTCADHINEKRYQVVYPSHYDSDPQVVDDPSRGLYYAIHENPDPYVEIYGRFPISEFVQMRFLNVPFQFVHQEDVLETYHICINYLEEIRGLIEADTDVQKYIANKFLPFVSEIEEAGRRVLNANPQWKDVYMRKDNSIFSLIHQIVNAKGDGSSDEDPFTKVTGSHPLTSPAGTHSESVSLPEKLRQTQNNQPEEPMSTTSNDDKQNGPPISIYGTPHAKGPKP